MRFGLGRAAAICAIAACNLSLCAAVADAATLAGIRAESDGQHSARVVLSFSNGVPGYKVFDNGSQDVSLVLAQTGRGLGPRTVAGSGSLVSISIEDFDTSLMVTLHESERARVSVAPGPGQTLIVTIAPADAGRSLPAPIPIPKPNPTLAPASIPAQAANTEIVRLKYADVSEVVGLLAPGQQVASNDSFTPQAQQFGSIGFGGAGTSFAGGALIGAVSAQQPVQLLNTSSGNGTSLGQQINEHLGIDRRLNAVLLTGTPAVIARYKAQIEAIDIPLSSVELEVQIVELDDSAAQDIGIDFTNAGGPLASATYGIKSLLSGQGAVNLQSAVYAQIQKGLGRTIARPRITALDGTTAQIITGTQIPIVTSIAVSGVSAVSSQVQYINVGVSLQIQPRISPDGFVTSHIFSQVSSQTGTVQNYPELSQREASTLATVRDGESFVIGGLLQQNEIQSLARVPGFGDLPLIGGFFRVRHDSSQHTNLYIIVTPHILKTGSNPVHPAGPSS